jgi:hypothetical protein
MNTEGTAQAFANKKSGKCHNAVTDGQTYKLHGNTIAEWVNGSVIINWCGWYTSTTARHLNEVLAALGSNHRVSYAQAREERHTWSIVE